MARTAAISECFSNEFSILTTIVFNDNVARASFTSGQSSSFHDRQQSQNIFKGNLTLRDWSMLVESCVRKDWQKLFLFWLKVTNGDGRKVEWVFRMIWRFNEFAFLPEFPSWQFLARLFFLLCICQQSTGGGNPLRKISELAQLVLFRMADWWDGGFILNGWAYRDKWMNRKGFMFVSMNYRKFNVLGEIQTAVDGFECHYIKCCSLRLELR